MKKIIKILFLDFIFLHIFLVSVNAVDSNIFTVTDATGSKDEEVTIYISLNRELEFASADLVLEYDISKLEYVKYTELDIFEKSAMNVVKNNTDTGKIAIGYVSNPDKNALTKSPGQMLSITFKIISNIEETTDINLNVTSLKKDSGESIDVSDIKSKINIVAKENSINENAKQKEDNTTINYNNKEKKILPKTGRRMRNVTYFFGILAGFSFYSYKKYVYLRKI